MTAMTRMKLARILSLACMLFVASVSVCFAQNNPSIISFKVKTGDTHTFDISSTTTPNFELISEINNWGSVKRYDDFDNDNVYQVDFNAPVDFVGEIEFIFTYTGVNPFPFYTYTRQTKVIAEVVHSLTETKDDYLVVDGSGEFFLNPVSNDVADESILTLHSVAYEGDLEANVLEDNILQVKIDNPEFRRSLIKYIIQEEEEFYSGNLYVLKNQNLTGDDSEDVIVSTENPVKLFVPSINFELVSQDGKKGKVVKEHSMVYEYQPISGRLGSDRLLFRDDTGNEYTFNITVIDNAPDLDAVMDDEFFTAVDQEIEFNVAENDLIDPSSIIYHSPELEKISDGIFSYQPPAGFRGFKTFKYKVHTGESILDGNIIIKIDNYNPIPLVYNFKTGKNKDLILDYEIPLIGYTFNELLAPKIGTLELFNHESNVQVECGTLNSKVSILYSPRAHFVGFDEFELQYCTEQDQCVGIKIKVQVYDDNNPDCNCVSDCVWPGDADNNGIVNGKDLLNIGYNIGLSGSSRHGGSDTWVSQSAEDWSSSGYEKINVKYSDSDGNGIITEQDINAIVNNYGLIHSIIPTSAVQVEKSPLKLVPLQENLKKGDILSIDVELGNTQFPVLDLHGLAMSIRLSPQMFDIQNAIFIPKDDSWLLDDLGNLTIVEGDKNGGLDISLTRITGLPKSGKGKIGTIQIVVVGEEIDGFDPEDEREIPIEIDNIIAMNSNGGYFTMPAQAGTIKLDKNTRLNDSNVTDLQVHPTYTNTVVEVKGMVLGEKIINVTDVSGKILLSKVTSGNQERINIAEFNAGIYFLNVYSRDNIYTQKILKY